MKSLLRTLSNWCWQITESLPKSTGQPKLFRFQQTLSERRGNGCIINHFILFIRILEQVEMETASQELASPHEPPDQSNYMKVLEMIAINFNIQHEVIPAGGANAVFSSCLMDNHAKWASQLPEGLGKNLLARLCSLLGKITIQEIELDRMVTKIRQDGKFLTQVTTLSTIFVDVLGEEYKISQPLKMLAGEFLHLQREYINSSRRIDSEGMVSHMATQLYKSSKLLNDYLLVLGMPTTQKFFEGLEKLKTQLKDQTSDHALALNVIDTRIIRQIELLISNTSPPKINSGSFSATHKLKQRKCSEGTKSDSPNKKSTQQKGNQYGPSESASDGHSHQSIKPQPEPADQPLCHPEPVNELRNDHEIEYLWPHQYLQLHQQSMEFMDQPKVAIIEQTHNPQNNNETAYQQVRNYGGQERSSSGSS